MSEYNELLIRENTHSYIRKNIVFRLS